MPEQFLHSAFDLAKLAAEQRPRLVNLCAYLTGSRAAAEDLAQETLFEAWRHQSRLVNAEGADKWLSVVARHVCLRWRRAQGRQSRYQVEPNPSPTTAWEPDTLPDDAPELEIELERDELAELLDRALAQLPADTRDALIHKYIFELPQVEIAARLGLSEGAVEARLQRGKLSLRRLLQTDLRAEAETFGLFAALADRWQLTRIWCPICGQHKLYGQLPQGEQDFQLHCPRCSWAPNSYYAQSSALPDFVGVSGYKPILRRFMNFMYRYLEPGLRGEPIACQHCGQRVNFIPVMPSRAVAYPGYGRRGVSLKCPACGGTSCADIYGLALDTPQGQAFWRRHPRLRTQPEQPAAVDGRPAWLVRLTSISDNAHLDVLFDQERYAVLGIYPHDGGQ